MSADLMNFNLPQNKSSIIKVIGVGGGGSNAVNYMYNLGIDGVDFMVCNTDNQALEMSNVPNKVQLGVELTEGLGAGSKPDTGAAAASENIEDIKELLSTNTKMVFITAGMGGGTGTGAAPVIAQTARDMGILTVGIVTLPFQFEGRIRKRNADKGIEELKNCVDTLLIICNDRLREMYGNLSLSNAFGKADDVLSTGAKGIAEIVTNPGFINVDFKDVETVMTNGGTAIMGYSTASGDNRALKAVEQALSSPLLNDSSIKGAKQILVNITTARGESEASMDEIAEITDYIFDEAGEPDNVIPGVVFDDTLGDSISVIVIATHLESHTVDAAIEMNNAEKTVHNLGNEVSEPVVNEVKSETPSTPEEDEMIIIKKETPENTIKTEEVKATANKLSIGKTVVLPDSFIPSENKVEQESVEEELPSPTLFDTKEEVTDSEEAVNEDISDNGIKFVFKEEKEEEVENISQRVLNKSLSDERKMKLKKLSSSVLNIGSNDNIREAEEVPAFMRKNVNLDKVQHSSDSQVSRYTLSDGDDNSTELKENNPFLDDNVD